METNEEMNGEKIHADAIICQKIDSDSDVLFVYTLVFI